MTGGRLKARGGAHTGPEVRRGDVQVDPVGDGLNALRVTIVDNSVDQYFTKIFTDDVTAGVSFESSADSPSLDASIKVL